MARLLVDLMLEVKMQWISNRAAAAWSKARVGLEEAIPPVFLEPASPDAASSLAIPCTSGSLRSVRCNKVHNQQADKPRSVFGGS